MLEGLLAAHRRYDELSAQLSQPDAASDIGRYRALMKEYKELEPLSRQYLALAAAEEALAEAKELLYSHDAELSAMAAEQKAEAEAEITRLTEEARLMLGRTPGNIVAVRPLRQGVISDYTVTEKMLRYFIQKATGKKTFRKPRIAVCVPSGVTEVEKKAVEEATFAAGAREVNLIEEPVAAAIGSGIDITKPCGNMIVDIGGGTTDIAVISLAGTVVSNSVKISSETFDQDIIRYVRKTYNVFIGEQTAEAVKIRIGSAYPRAEEKTMEIKGRNVITGLPATITVSSDEIRGALAQTTNQIADAICAVLEKTPPELAADVSDRGIILTGGGSLLDGMDELIQERTGINTVTAENPASVVALGTGQYREVMNEFESQF